jgi:hypothetical protein
MTRTFKKLLLFAVILTLSAVTGYAQQLSATQGGLGGAITDKSGALVPGAKVTVSGDADTRTVTTDATGRFTIGSLTPGLYTVTVEKSGFSNAQAKKIEVVINRLSTIDLTLNPGAADQTVEVDASATQLDTGSTALGSDLTSTFYQQVPVARNVGSLFYTAPGVADGGGTGTANPSIGGSTGLENQYVADGVSIGDAGYGGLGVYSPRYGSLGTGINLSFIQEVQVKTGAFEPKYGKANGGIVQIVTKSGGSKYHGAITSYFSPENFSATQLYSDTPRVGIDPATTLDRADFRHGNVLSQPAYDGSIELGGYIPIQKNHDRLFFFGAYNPSLNQVSYITPDRPFSAAMFAHGPFTSSVLANNWAGKLTYKLNEGTSFDVSAFGDPSRSNYAYNAEFADPAAFNPLTNFLVRDETAFSRWNYGSRSVVARMTSAVSPTLLVNMSASAKTSHFDETGFANVFQITDKTNSSRGYQGLGEYQNPNTHDYGFSIDAQKTVRALGSHTFSIGWAFERTIYDSNRDYSGGRFVLPDAIATAPAGNPGLVGQTTGAAFYLANAPAGCTNRQLCPIYAATGQPVYLRQVRGILSSSDVSSSEGYHVLYGNDNYSIGRHITLNLGIRWEEEQLNGPNQQYVFVDNWSPRLGINIDPFGDGKSKVFFNWGHYTQALPADAAIRELNQEEDFQARWGAPANADGTLATNADGTITPILDSAHLLNGKPNTGYTTTAIVASPSTPELFAPGTKLNYEEEFVAGVEREFGGFVFSARYTDRRLKRIVEDMGGASPEGANAGVPQVFVIGNPNPSADYFVNEQEEKYTGAVPADCELNYGAQEDSLFNDLGSACALNYPSDGGGAAIPGAAGYPTPDGKPDGFATPVRRYQALEIEANKNFSHNFLLRVNYRFAKLNGNYEGLFRNDNGQSDPGISSLFDFTTGVLGLLGAQFQSGPLNTDRRDVGNLYGSYTMPRGYLRKLSIGTGLRGQSGTPINKLVSHPVYQNTGEIPIGGRGIGGRLPSTLQLDMHLDYPVSLGEKGAIKLAFDMFNVTDSRFTTNSNQYLDRGFQIGADPTYGYPNTFQRAFYGRGSVRWEF